jgi:hypothetical protein
MTLRFSSLDLRSLLIVLFAFIGNAQVGGLDLVLLIVVPALFVLNLTKPWKLPYLSYFLYLFFAVVLLMAAFQAYHVAVPYFEDYYIWPLKAFILMTFVAFSGPPRWTMTNMFALSMIALALIVTGSFESGRLHSAFGPNMLYRLFGMLALFSAMQGFQKTRGKPHATVAMFGLGMVGLVLTGSSGALVVVAAIVALYLYRWSRRVFFSLAIGAAAGIVILLVTQSGAGALYFIQDSNISVISRSFYKIETLEADARMIGLKTLFTAPFSVFGYQHADFAHLWFFGYQYPHNIFAELYAFYGIIGLILIAAILLTIRKLTVAVVLTDTYFLTFIILLIGSNLSGDLSDNYGLVGLACGLLVRASQSVRTRKRAIPEVALS